MSKIDCGSLFSNMQHLENFIFSFNLWYYSWTTVQFSRSVLTLCDPMNRSMPGRPPTPRVYPSSCPLSQWCHLTISSSVIPFSSCPQSLPASGSFPMSQLFASGGQSTEVSASTSVLPMNTQDWSPWGWTGWISLQSKGLSRVFFNMGPQQAIKFAARSPVEMGNMGSCIQMNNFKMVTTKPGALPSTGTCVTYYIDCKLPKPTTYGSIPKTFH